MQLTKSDFDNWWNAPVGLEFRKMLKEDLDKLAHGNMTNAEARDTIGNAQKVGSYNTVMHFIKLQHTDILGEE